MSETQEKPKEFPSVGGSHYQEGIIYEQILDSSGYAKFARNDSGELSETIKPFDATSDSAAKKTFRVLDPNHLPWLAASDPECFKSVEDEYLFSAIAGFLELYIDFTDKRLYKVIAAWIMATWLLETWRVAAPLYVLGPVNSGKTTVLECLEQVSYRGIRGGSMSTSTMFRLDDQYHPTLLLDESQIYNQDTMGEAQALINERYRKGGKVWRIIGEGKDMIPNAFKVFGFSAFASNHPPWEALSSRAVLVRMEKNREKVRQTLTPVFELQGKELRTWLLQYRFKHLQLWTPQYEEEDPVDRLLEKLGDYRTREIGYALLKVAPENERQTVLGYLESLEKTHQALENTAYLADYVVALNRCEPENSKVSAQAVRYQLAILRGAFDDKGKIISKEIPKPQSVMKALRTLGFQDTRMSSNGATGVTWDKELLDRLTLRYNVKDASKASGTSGTNVNGPEAPEEPDADRGQRPLETAAISSDTTLGGTYPLSKERGKCASCQREGPLQVNGDGAFLVCSDCYTLSEIKP